ncbi:hypothetical protein Sjap_006799 [Stephania japonica]|uniref:ACB domain-containing protein n=1 Tax=Stephania japonica TaxID=461633 RepID=A0AAP0K6H9_9MAGN
MAMARASSGLAYPERFHAAASYAGFGGSGNSSDITISKFSNETALLLYGLYQQVRAISAIGSGVCIIAVMAGGVMFLDVEATVGPCAIPKPRAWSPVEQNKWTRLVFATVALLWQFLSKEDFLCLLINPYESGYILSCWHGLGNMPSAEAMRLFVKILEEEDPAWYSRVPEFVIEPVVDVEMNDNQKVNSIAPNGNYYPETKTIPAENGSVLETQDKDVVLEGFGSVGVYDQWIAPSISGQRPKPRYEHGAAIVQDKMYVFGGNHNGRYLNDLQVLDLRTLSWSRVETKAAVDSVESSSPVPLSPCAGHSLISWGNKLLSIAGHTKDPSESVTVKAFDPLTSTWSILKTYGKAPLSRGGQSITLVGSNLVMFGGQDAKRTLLNDLHILDLETMTWDDIDAVGVPPSPRSDHAAAVHAERYLLIFGGGSHSTCFNDLHVLDLQSMEWSTPAPQGEIPSPRAGHAGVTVGENWFIVGGGDNKSASVKTLFLLLKGSRHFQLQFELRHYTWANRLLSGYRSFEINKSNLGASETMVLNMSTLVWSVVTTVQGRVPLASEGLSLSVSSYNNEDIIVAFGGYNGRYSNEVNVLKPSHKSSLQSDMIDRSVPDSVAALHNATNLNGESEIEVGQEGKIREIVMDNVDSEPVNIKSEDNGEHILATLKAEKEELEATLTKEQLLTLQLKQELAEAITRNAELTKASELQSVRGQLASEQSRCFKLEVDVAELRQKLQAMETLQKELELLQRQKAASEQAALDAKQRQSSGGVWGWLAGSPTNQN